MDRDADFSAYAGARWRARRRRRRTTAVMSAAVVLIGGFGVATQLARSDRPGAPDHGEERVADTGAPDGYRLVGIGRVAIAVPATWATDAAGCNTPTRDTAFFPWPQDCVIPGPDHQVSSVAITRGGFTQTGPPLRALRPADRLRGATGHDVVESIMVCQTTPAGPCTRTVGVPDLHAYFSITIAGDGADPTGQLETIRSSLLVLPADQRAVPSVEGVSMSVDDARAVLEEAGFDVAVREPPCPTIAYCGAGSVAGTDPEAGSILPVGATVVLSVNT